MLAFFFLLIIWSIPYKKQQLYPSCFENCFLSLQVNWYGLGIGFLSISLWLLCLPMLFVCLCLLFAYELCWHAFGEHWGFYGWKLVLLTLPLPRLNCLVFTVRLLCCCWQFFCGHQGDKNWTALPAFLLFSFVSFSLVTERKSCGESFSSLKQTFCFLSL